MSAYYNNPCDRFFLMDEEGYVLRLITVARPPVHPRAREDRPPAREDRPPERTVLRSLAQGSDTAVYCTTCQVMLWTLYHSNFCQIVRDRFSVISYIVAGHWLPVQHRGWALASRRTSYRGCPAGMSLRASLYPLTNKDTDFIKDDADNNDASAIYTTAAACSNPPYLMLFKSNL